MTLYEILTDPQTGLDIPVVYSHFKNASEAPEAPPYIAYIGAGQDNFEADNTFYFSRNRYQIEYYFTEKNEEQEADLEQVLKANGLLYDKSDDVFLEDLGVFVIYYTV
jgi:hypothetical protein